MLDIKGWCMPHGQARTLVIVVCSQSRFLSLMKQSLEVKYRIKKFPIGEGVGGGQQKTVCISLYYSFYFFSLLPFVFLSLPFFLSFFFLSLAQTFGISLVCFYLLNNPQGGTTDTEIKVPSAENPRLLKVLSFIPG